jgi:hypothetical protein
MLHIALPFSWVHSANRAPRHRDHDATLHVLNQGDGFVDLYINIPLAIISCFLVRRNFHPGRDDLMGNLRVKGREKKKKYEPYPPIPKLPSSARDHCDVPRDRRIARDGGRC